MSVPCGHSTVLLHGGSHGVACTGAGEPLPPSLTLLLLLAAVGGELCLAGYWLAASSSAERAGLYATGALLLIAAAAIDARAAWALLRHPVAPPTIGGLLQAMLVAAWAAYGLCLAIGPRPGTSCCGPAVSPCSHRSRCCRWRPIRRPWSAGGSYWRLGLHGGSAWPSTTRLWC